MWDLRIHAAPNDMNSNNPSGIAGRVVADIVRP